MVQDVKGLEFSSLEFLVHDALEPVNFFSDAHHHKRVGEQRPKFEHVTLIVQQFSLNFCARDGGELAAAGGIPYSNKQSSPQAATSVED